MAKIIALSTNTTKEYILKDQREDPKEDQIIFEIRSLTASEEELLENKLGSVNQGGFDVRIGTQNRLALDLGLVGVRNFCDEHGNELELVRDKAKKAVVRGRYPIKDEFLDRVPKSVRAEVARAILGEGELEEEDLKN